MKETFKVWDKRKEKKKEGCGYTDLPKYSTGLVLPQFGDLP